MREIFTAQGKPVEVLFTNTLFKKGDVVHSICLKYLIIKCPNDKLWYCKFLNKITFGFYKLRKGYLIKSLTLKQNK